MTPESCDEGFNCNYFEGIYCGNTIPCNDDWPYLPSCSPDIYDYDCSLRYDFKCDVDRFSQFSLNLILILFLWMGYILLRIVCSFFKLESSLFLQR